MKTLVAGFGNILLGDDGFGVEVIRRVARDGVPESTEVVDVGIGGFDLVLKLKEGFDQLIVVDLVRRGGRPGSVTTFHPCAAETTLRAGERIDPHITEPSRAMKLARQLEVLPPVLTVIGCEPERCDVGIGLSAPVAAAVDEAVATIHNLVQACLSNSSKP